MTHDWLVSRKDALSLRRRIVFSRAGRVGIAQRFEVAGSYDSILATTRCWFASLVVVREGALGFRDARGARAMAAPRFLLFVPAGSLVRMPLERAKVETIGISGRELPAGIAGIPMAIPCDLDLPEATDERRLFEILRRSGAEAHRIDADRGVPLRERRIRARLSQIALGPSPVGQVAAERAMPLSMLSRVFSSAYGLSPRDYCQRVRVYAAALLLVDGISIAEAALEAGWNDLSRFYRQFRRGTGETPGRYKRAGASGEIVK